MNQQAAAPMPIRPFGVIDDHPVEEITLRSRAGAQARIITYGAVVRDLVVPKPGGGQQRVVLGLNTIEDYQAHSPHFGAIAGRYANRIRHGRFALDGKTYQLPLNQAGLHSLHGGGDGFGKQNWRLLHHDADSATLGLVSPDGDAGYPGTLHITCRYRLEEPATLRVELSAHTDAPTIINLAHHSYFTLDDAPDILDHHLVLNADLMTPVDADLIPDGSLAMVANTPFDFRQPRAIRHMAADGSRSWYDHNFILRRDNLAMDRSGLGLSHAATLSSPLSQLAMQVWTSEPCLQFYDGFKSNLPVEGLDGARYGASSGLCLEPQHAPDSPNLPHLPSTVLRPGELYRQVTQYRFGKSERLS